MPRKTVHFYLDNRCLSLSLGKFLSVQEHDKRIECYCFFFAIRIHVQNTVIFSCSLDLSTRSDTKPI